MSIHFPTDCLPPGIFQDYIKFNEENSEAHPAYHFGSLLTASSLMLGHRSFFRNGPHIIRPNFYTLIIGRSGFSRKSSAVQPMINIIEKVRSDAILEGNFSAESMISLFKANNERLLFLDEVKHIFDQNKKKFGQGVTTTITKLFNCPSTLKSEYKADLDKYGNSENLAIDPYLCILGLTTIDWFEASDQDIMGGFIGRFFPIKIKDHFRQWIPNPKWDLSLEQKIVSKFHDMRRIKGQFTWSSEAQLIWNKYYQELMECASTAEHYQSGSFGSRTGDYLIKLSMIFNAVNHGTKEIQADSIIQAKRFIDLAFGYHIELLESFSSSKLGKELSRLISIVHHKGGMVDHSYLLRYSKLSSDEFEKLILTLRVSERLFMHMVPNVSGKPKKVYYDPNMVNLIEGKLERVLNSLSSPKVHEVGESLTHSAPIV